MESMKARRGSTSMEPMAPRRPSLLGPLTRSEEILQFERLRHQIYIVEALRGLKIATPPSRSGQHAPPPPPPIPWRKLRTVPFSDLVMDTVQEGCMIKCRTVVEPLLFGSLQTLVEDIDGGFKVMMVSIDNFVTGINVMELGVLFPVGRELWIRNPCVKAHEGRPIIKVDDPINLKLRQNSREIERILEYGPTDAKGWKTKGNEMVKRGKLTEAINAYSSGIDHHLGGSNKLRASLLRRRAEIFYKLEKYQAARRDCVASLTLPKNDKTFLILAKVLLELRSYSTALKCIHQMSELDEEADKLHRQLWTCDIEHRDGIYHVIPIAEEAHLNDRVVHADYVSPYVELRAEGVGGRGLFATKKLPGGTLLLVSKAVLCVYADEVPKQPEQNGDEEPQDMFDVVRQRFIERLVQMLNNGTGRRILQLAGGSQSDNANIDLRRDDVYDNGVHFVSEQIKQIVMRNSFGGAQRSQILADATDDSPQSKVGGGALFYAPSFFNHSCVPNSTYFTIGDMMFVKTNREIEEGEELMIHYIYVEKMNEKERNETLDRVWGFTCQCELCEWERENEDICSAADKIMDKVLEFAKTATPEAAVKKFQAARKKLYQLYRFSPPHFDDLITLDTPFVVPPSSSLASYLVLIFRELSQGEIREYIRDTELSGPINAEYHFLLKNYSHYERVCVAGLPALRVWQYLYRNSMAPETVEAWLKEAKESHDMLLGEGHFYYQYGEVIKEVKSE